MFFSCRSTTMLPFAFKFFLFFTFFSMFDPSRVLLPVVVKKYIYLCDSGRDEMMMMMIWLDCWSCAMRVKFLQFIRTLLRQSRFNLETLLIYRILFSSIFHSLFLFDFIFHSFFFRYALLKFIQHVSWYFNLFNFTFFSQLFPERLHKKYVGDVVIKKKILI